MDERKTILHLGMGAFHRAHQAVYLQRLIDSGDASWTLASGNIRGDQRAVESALIKQGGAYTVESVSPAGICRYRWIESIGLVVPYSPSLAGLIEIAERASTRIISFTVTEAGYHLDDALVLEAEALEVAADLNAHRAGMPGATLYGALAAMLDARRRAGSGAITLLNCDNLRHNGHRARSGLLQFLALAGNRTLAEWIKANTTWPNSMVDRITPRPTTYVSARVLSATGRADAAPVMAEDFMQWVIEDDFCNGRPDWSRAGAEMVQSAAPYEEAKIRILNASHSCLAWAGVLAGYCYIHEAAGDARIRSFAHAYVSDVTPCLRPSPIDLVAYRDTVLARFANAALADSNERVVADGFAKLPGFIVPTLRENLRAGRPIQGAAMLPALFLSFLKRWCRAELGFEYRDQAMEPMTAHAICSAADPVGAFSRVPALWGDLAGDARLLEALRSACEAVDEFEMACHA